MPRRSLLSLLLFPLASLVPGNAAGQLGTGSDAPSCEFREVSRNPLTVEGGDLLYVEPRALVRSGERLLLAGTPNYRWRGGDPPQLDSSVVNTLFGVVLEPDGAARAIPSPVPAGLLRDVRALPREDGGWDVLFVETNNHFAPPTTDTVVRVWSGVLHGNRWSALDTLPLSDRGWLQVSNTSPLVRFGDTLAWAATVQGPDEGGVHVFRRIAGGWHREAMGIRNPAYVRLFHSDTLGLAAVVLRPDQERGGANNALDLFARRDSWTLIRQVVYSGPEVNHAPAVDPTRSGPALSWWTRAKDDERIRLEGRLLHGPLEAATGRWVVLDSAVAQIEHLRYQGDDVWVVNHAFPGEPQEELRFLRLSEGRPQRMGHGENPYTGYFAVAESSGQILLAGPLLDRSGSSPVLVSLLLRYAPSCRH